MRDIQQLLQDMLESIRAIESYTVSSYEAFLADEKTQDAIMFNLIIMGETFQEQSHSVPAKKSLS
jgi:uncharacterized protein with HEPN domain